MTSTGTESMTLTQTQSKAKLPIIDITSWLEAVQNNTSGNNVVPVINVASCDYEHPSQAQLACSTQLHLACREHGFFYLSGHGCSQVQMDSILDMARQFFARPQEEKDSISISKQDQARGYQKLGENVTQYKADHHEGLDLYRPVPSEAEDKNRPLHGKNQWPANPRDFREVYEKWIEQMQQLGRLVMLCAAKGLGMDAYEADALLGLVDESFWVLRAISYPRLPPDSSGISCGAHKDYGAWTFLLADETKGALQVYKSDTQEWLSADPIPGAFVVNIGEMWEIWTNGLYRATLHRVIHSGESTRVSVPFFFEASFDAYVEPLEAALRIQEAEEDGHKTKGLKKGVVYGEFLTRKVAGNFQVQT